MDKSASNQPSSQARSTPNSNKCEKRSYGGSARHSRKAQIKDSKERGRLRDQERAVKQEQLQRDYYKNHKKWKLPFYLYRRILNFTFSHVWYFF